jgi:outer membrane murein-binding lipoprotein Lpp
MKRSANEAFVLGIVVVTIWITGCAQPEPMNVKMSRVIAAENMQLKEDLRKSDWEIKNLKELHAEQVDKLEKLIEEYKGQVKIWEEKSRQNIRNQVKDILDVVLERNAELREEIKALKEDNEKLKTELEEQKKKAMSQNEL